VKLSAAMAIIATVTLSCSGGPYAGDTDLPFYDGFDRPNTSAGLGGGWDMRGPYVDGFPLPPAKDGFISNGSYTYAGDHIVYATRHFTRTVHRLGTSGRWRSKRDGSETTLAMAISRNNKLVAEMVHFAANRGVWELTVRRPDGEFEPIAGGNFQPTLSLDRDYRFEVEAVDDEVTVRVPGKEVSTRVPTADLVGNWGFWQQYSATRPAGVVFDFDEVWAR